MSNTTMSGPINRRSSGCTPPPVWRGALACNRLRIDPSDGSPVVDYRIEDGRVERRTLVLQAPGKGSDRRAMGTDFARPTYFACVGEHSRRPLVSSKIGGPLIDSGLQRTLLRRTGNLWIEPKAALFLEPGHRQNRIVITEAVNL